MSNSRKRKSPFPPAHEAEAIARASAAGAAAGAEPTEALAEANEKEQASQRAFEALIKQLQQGKDSKAHQTIIEQLQSAHEKHLNLAVYASKVQARTEMRAKDRKTIADLQASAHEQTVIIDALTEQNKRLKVDAEGAPHLLKTIEESLAGKIQLEHANRVLAGINVDQKRSYDVERRRSADSYQYALNAIEAHEKKQAALQQELAQQKEKYKQLEAVYHQQQKKSEELQAKYAEQGKKLLQLKDEFGELQESKRIAAEFRDVALRAEAQLGARQASDASHATEDLVTSQTSTAQVMGSLLSGFAAAAAANPAVDLEAERFAASVLADSPRRPAAAAAAAAAETAAEAVSDPDLYRYQP